MCGVDFGVAVLLKFCNQIGNRARLLCVVVVKMIVHLYERPLRPLVILGVAGAEFAAPIVAKADFFELRTVTVDVLLGSDGGVLTRLYCVLLGGQAECVVSHRVEHIESFEPLVTAVNVGCNVSEWVSYVESRARRVGEHIEDVIFRLVRRVADLVRLVVFPIFLPKDLYFTVIVFHCLYI